MNTEWIGKWKSTSGLIAVVALVAWAIGLASNRGVAMQSYIYAFTVWGTLTFGCLGMTLLHHVTRARFSRPFLRIWEAGGGAAMILVFALLFLPIAANLSAIYPWADPKHVAEDKILQDKSLYLNPGFFIGRTVAYLAIWALLAHLLRKSSLREDRTGAKSETDFRANLSAPGIVAFMLTMTFAVTDWVMSLEPHWFSSIFGIWFGIQMALTALAFATFFVLKNRDKDPFREAVPAGTTKDAGTLLFAFTMFWGYITLSQFLIIYAANQPETTEYYIVRSANGWPTLMTLTAITQFFIPWLSLLAPRAKRTVWMLMTITAVILLARFVDLYWIVMPAIRDHPAPLWTDLAALAGIGGVWFTVFGWQLGKAPAIANHPPRTEEESEQEAVQHA